LRACVVQNSRFDCLIWVCVDLQLCGWLGCQDTVAFVETADITRWDIILPFSIDDVPKDKIARN